MKSISTVVIAVTVASVALTVVDVAFLIANWVSDHPTVEVLNNVIKQLTKELERFNDINSTTDTFKEKAYLSFCCQSGCKLTPSYSILIKQEGAQGYHLPE
ncbi:unnamed protein product, partial [Rotaria magnacalcarata]